MAATLFNGTSNSSNDITIDMLDYQYIDNCSNIKELEKILRALRSGKDGYYPHLISHCEDKVRGMNPTSKALRKLNPITRTKDLPADEAEVITNGIGEWKNEIHSNASDDQVNGCNIPPVRQTTTLKGTKSTVTNPSSKSQRIRSYDYKAWDKFDADKECENAEKQPQEKPRTTPTSKMSDKVDATGLSEYEMLVRATSEKDKGNEAFKSADFEAALTYYSRSISLSRTAASINNRALAYIRLQRWKEAESDCNEVLQLEPDNLKARLRRATARKELLKYIEAKNDLSFVLDKEPHNTRASKILEEVEQNLSKSSSGDASQSSRTGRKMMIAEVSSDEEETDPPTANHCEIKEKDVPDTVQSEVAPISATVNGDDTEKVSKDDKVGPGDVETTFAAEEPHVEQPPPEMPQSVLKIKNSGKELFLSGQYADAAQLYTKALNTLQACADKSPDLDHSCNIALLYNNRAACHLKVGDDKACIADCNEVLILKGMDTKALIRRAYAFEHMEKYQQAYLDFRSAQTVDWSIKQAQDGANRVASHLRDIHGPKWKSVLTGDRMIVTQHQKTTNSNQEDDTKPSAQKQSKPDYVKSTIKPNNVPKQEIKKEKSNKSKRPQKSKAVPKQKAAGKAAGAKEKSSNPTEADREKKKEEIRRNLFDSLKNNGNTEVKKGNFEKAVECYTKSMNICPDEIASYTNRALCYLKLNKPVSAIEDCTEAIKRDPKNIKAMFRRAQANKNLKKYKQALDDLNKVLQLEPENKSAHAELMVVRKLMNNINNEDFIIKPSSTTKSPMKSKDAAKKEKKRKIIIEDADSDEEAVNISENNGKEDTVKTTPIKPDIVTNGVASKEEVQSKLENIKPTVELEEIMKQQVQTTEVIEKKTEQTEPNLKLKEPEEIKPTLDNPIVTSTKDGVILPQEIKSPVQPNEDTKPSIQPQDPLTPTNTSTNHIYMNNTAPFVSPYEFGNAWNAVQPKHAVSTYKMILDRVPVKNIPELVTNKTTDHMIVTFAKIARYHLIAGVKEEVDRAYGILSSLSLAQRFNMAAMFLSKPDKKHVSAAIDDLEAALDTGSFTKADVENLRVTYML
uniref:sperm-associated antigen 1 n=1 Tax=Ciona intestinalis TaxID=7719 RepID=UPI000180CAAA|nr:sperm-associated antigen 1 [Ciona intestinalis]|eukprot:XP_002122252.1 sperm-associated antigen 1 [Ciona intestinalis]